MRRGLASLIIGLSLIVASASWAGFILSHTILDPGRSERVADQMLESPEVRKALTSRLADALESQVPADIPVPRQVLEAGAAQALDDPRVEALIRDGFVRVHQNALAGNSEPVVIDAGALGASGRDALVQTRPELDPFLPAAPVVAVELPGAGLSWIGSVKNFVDRFTLFGAMVSAVGAVTAFVVARERAPVLRRVAFWGYGASAFWLLVAYGIPWVGGILSPTSAAIATAAADIFFGAMIRPAVAMAVFSTVLLAAGLVLPMLENRRGVMLAQPRRGPTAAAGVVGGPVGPRTGSPGQRARPSGRPVDNTAPMPRPGAPTVHPPIVDHRVDGVGRPGWRQEVGVDISFLDQSTAPAEDPTPTRPPVWREGYGYIDPDDIPEYDPADPADEDLADRFSTTPVRERSTDPGATRRFQP